MLRVGIVGCGAIGTELCKAITHGIAEDIKLVSVFDRHITQSKKLVDSIACTPLVENTSQMSKHVDIIVECASAAAVPGIARTALSSGCSVLIMSVGALANNELINELTDLARKHSTKIYLPSGAVAGIDGIKGAMIGGIDRVTLSTYKHPGSLRGAPYIIEKNINCDTIKEKTLIFSGSAREAAVAFPANINVAATISFAGIGADNTQVNIYADPMLKRNIHKIVVEGNFGKFESVIENKPSPTNPKTSYLAALSAIATLKQIINPLQIGT